MVSMWEILQVELTVLKWVGKTEYVRDENLAEPMVFLWVAP